MQPVVSTAEVLLHKVLNRDVEQIWIDWALEMLIAGFDTENLVILAGESEPSPYNQFYLQELTSKVLAELALDLSNPHQLIKNYVYHLINNVIIDKIKSVNALSILKNLCQELNDERSLYNLCLLYWAKEDLSYADEQWYWEGADKYNIDQIIIDYFIDWKLTYETGNN